MPNPTPPAVTCPNCGESASGRFCSECGAALKGASCAACHADLVVGAKFCHRCGAAAGAASPPASGRATAPRTPVAKSAAPKPASASPAAAGFAAAAPWAVGGIALVALIALISTYRFGGSDAPAESPAAGPMAGASGGASSVDISSMTPRERADRLFNRIMRYASEGKNDSAQFFAPMAISAFQMIPDPDADSRYDLGRVAEVAGALPLAKAEADTILKASPTNLLGLILAMNVAKAMGDDKKSAAYGARLRAAAPAERKKANPEYQLHASDIDRALADAQP